MRQHYLVQIPLAIMHRWANTEHQHRPWSSSYNTLLWSNSFILLKKLTLPSICTSTERTEEFGFYSCSIHGFVPKTQIHSGPVHGLCLLVLTTTLLQSLSLSITKYFTALEQHWQLLKEALSIFVQLSFITFRCSLLSSRSLSFSLFLFFVHGLGLTVVLTTICPTPERLTSSDF